MAAFLIPYGGAIQIDGIPLVTRDAQDYLSNPTLASGDVKLSKDGGALANLDVLPVVAPASGYGVRLTLSAGNTNFKLGRVLFRDQTASKEWEDQSVLLATYGNASAFIVGDLADIAKNSSVAKMADMVILSAAMAKDATVSKPGTAQTITAPATMATLASVAAVSGSLGGQVATMATAANMAILSGAMAKQATLAAGVLSLSGSISGVQTVVNLLQVYPRGVQLDDFEFEMVLAADHATPATGVVVTGAIAKDGGAFAALGGVIAEKAATGVFNLDSISAAEMTANGITLRFTAPLCDPLVIFMRTQA